LEPDIVDDDTLELSRTAALGNPSTDAGRRALSEVFHLYFDTVEAACADMRRASSPADVRRQAHRAKGASGVVGAVRLGQLFADIEARAAAGESIGADTYGDLERHLAALRRTVSALTGDGT
jgi:HPt (histidine-containing phosphotransfer) domain-containing protein